MSLLVLGESNVERAWLSVRNNRELLRSAVFVPVKRIDQLQAGFQAMTSNVRLIIFNFVSQLIYFWLGIPLSVILASGLIEYMSILSII